MRRDRINNLIFPMKITKMVHPLLCCEGTDPEVVAVVSRIIIKIRSFT